MEDLKSIQKLKEQIEGYINSSSLTTSEKDLIEIFINILDLLYDFILNNQNTVNRLSEIKNKIIQFLEKKYTKTEFYILDVNSCDHTSN